MAKRTRSRKQKYRAILAIDPGSSAGVALFVDGKYAGSKACGGATFTSLYAAIEELMDETPVFVVSEAERLCVIEDGFGKGIGAKTLDRRRGLCMAAAETAGFADTVFIYPSTWHSEMFAARDSDGMKAEAMAWCKKWLNISPDTHDQAEAVVLGWYAAGQYM